jgi:hypothetical protein
VGKKDDGVWGTADFLAGRLGTCSDEESMISLSEFPVKKLTNRTARVCARQNGPHA